MNEHYAAVLADLRARRTKLEAEVQELDKAIGAIQRVAAVTTHGPDIVVFGVSGAATLIDAKAGPFSPPTVMMPASDARYSHISMRWAVLWHLSEFAAGWQKTAEIADALQKGGYKSDALRFGNLVSAVLSNMKAEGKNEVEGSTETGYRLTDKGRHAWEMIRQGHKFRAAIYPSSEQTLLSVQ